MPDLLTHAAIGAMLRARAPWHSMGWFVLGSVLPDLASRLPVLGLVNASSAFGLTVSLPLLEGLSVCHTPLPYLLLCWLVALLVPRAHRAVAWWNLSAAGLLHLALDATQQHLQGGYMLLFPLSITRWELGWVQAETSLKVLPLLAVAVGVVLGVRWWRGRRLDSPDHHSK